MIHISTYIVKRCLLVSVFLISILGVFAQNTSIKRDTLKKDSLEISMPWDAVISLPWNYDIKQKYYAGSASFITGSEMSRFRVANNSNTLAGRIPGLKTKMNGEDPGSDASNLYSRGVNSYNGRPVTMYVDNTPMSFFQLDPLEIDQLVVLKDAAANGTYGIQGANKVISVTTRRGIPFQNKISFYSQFGIMSRDKSPSFLGAKDYMTLHNEASLNDSSPTQFTSAQIAQYDNPTRDQYLYPDVNWHNELLNKQTTQQKYNLAFSGGSNEVRYFVLLGYMNQGGYYKNTDKNEEMLGFNTNSKFNRYNFRSNLNFKINPSLSVALDLAGRMETKNFPGSATTTGLIWGNLATYPSHLFPVQYQNGSIGGNTQYNRNPYGLITQTGYSREVNRTLLGTTRVEQKLDKLVKGLSILGSFSYYNYFTNSEGATLDFASYQMQQNGSYTKVGNDATYASRTRTQNQDRTTSFWGKLDYQRSFGTSHDLNAHAGFYQSVQTPYGDDFPYATQGFFGRVYYAWKKKYIAELNMGYNGSENLAPGNRYGFFPSLAAAWLLSEEDFLKNTKTDLLKLRASYGLSGNADFGIGGTGRQRYIFAGGYETGTSYAFGRTPVAQTARREGALANPDLTWETLKTANIGFDAAFFKNKIGATVDIFHEKREDILAVSSSLSGLIGIAPKPFNVGEVENKGIDWDVYYNNVLGDFSFSIHALGSYTKNKIIFQDEVIRPYAYLNRTGLPVSTPFGLEAIGFFANQNDVDNSPVQTFGIVKPGDIKYQDQNNDNRIDQYDEVAIGKSSGNPELYYGSTVEMKYKKFDLMVWFQGTGERTVNIINEATLGLPGARNLQILY